MNLQPRKVWTGQLIELCSQAHGKPEQVGSFSRSLRRLRGDEPSIWRMELPNTSYAAPQAAFWWVSNEAKR